MIPWVASRMRRRYSRGNSFRSSTKARQAGEVPFDRLDGLAYVYTCREGNYTMENVLVRWEKGRC